MRARARPHGRTAAREKLPAVTRVAVCVLVMFTVQLCGRAAVRPLFAQDTATVRTARQLAADGRGDSARTLLSAELRRRRAGSPEYVEALYWRARLASTGDSAERDFRRVAIEHSGSAYADDALLQLAQLKLASGDAAAAYDLAARMRSDYPASELKPRAAFWAARAAFATGEPRTACALLDSARAEAAADVEFANQVEFYRARCASLAHAPLARETTLTVAAPSAPAPPRNAAPIPGFEVQVAASRTAAAARTVADRLQRAGWRARVVAGGDGYHRVRLGPYASRDSADAASRAARRITGGAPFVVSVPP